jgi:hypothetical protein
MLKINENNFNMQQDMGLSGDSSSHLVQLQSGNWRIRQDHI